MTKPIFSALYRLALDMKALRAISKFEGARQPSLAAILCAFILMIAGSTAVRAIGGDAYNVSQRDRQFMPGTLSVKRGQTVRIVNDDADLLHHAYIESDTFNFDSGDQEPGSKTDIVFSVHGDFKVLCGIHPKMKLFVHVN